MSRASELLPVMSCVSDGRHHRIIGPRPIRISRAIVLGAGVPAGWVLHDAAVFLTNGHPPTMLEILSGSLVAIVTGALAGWWLGRRPLVAAMLGVACGLVAAGLRIADVRLASSAMWLPRALALLFLAFAVAAWLHRRSGIGAVRLAVCAGILACIAKTVYRHGVIPGTWVYLACGLAALSLGLLPRTHARRLATTLVLLVAAFFVWGRMAPHLRPTRPDLPPPGVIAASDAPNLVLILLDTLRADRISAYGSQRLTMPGIDAFARLHGTTYLDARATSSWTLPSTASIFTGLFPAEHHATNPRRRESDVLVRKGRPSPAHPLRADVPTLAELLRSAGYQTAAILANGFNINPKLGLDRGFEHFDARADCWIGNYLALAQLGGGRPWAGHRAYRSAATITDVALNWLDTRRRTQAPLCLVLNYMDCHWPYLPPPPYDRAFSEERPRDPLSPEPEMRALLYDRAAFYLDAQVTRLLAGLEERDIFDGTAIILVSDHGEAFGEHSVEGHSLTLYEELLHIPLIVKPARGRTVASDSRPVTGADVFHLALREMGVEAGFPREEPDVVAEWYRAFRPSAPDRHRFDRDLVAWMQGRTKFIVCSRGTVEAFDLDRDPDELAPLELSHDEIEAAQRRAYTWWEANPPPETTNVEASQESLELLRALGY